MIALLVTICAYTVDRPMPRPHPIIWFTLLFFTQVSWASSTIPNPPAAFDSQHDLLLFNFDLKTDVDDLHTVAALNLILNNEKYRPHNYIALHGTYGLQAGLFVPAKALFRHTFGSHWVDIHGNRDKAFATVLTAMHKTLSNQGRIWIAEAGQSDISAALISSYRTRYGALGKSQIVIVQHSQWNEDETSQEALALVKQHATYIKIPDGNAADNGTPGFNDPTFAVNKLEQPGQLSRQTWQLANQLSRQYNGKNERYLNQTIADGGADFSDLAEVIWILQIAEVDTVAAFFAQFNGAE